MPREPDFAEIGEERGLDRVSATSRRASARGRRDGRDEVWLRAPGRARRRTPGHGRGFRHARGAGDEGDPAGAAAHLPGRYPGATLAPPSRRLPFVRSSRKSRESSGPGVCASRSEKAPRAGLLQSPPTDSNRRPPPYHGGWERHTAAGSARDGLKWSDSAIRHQLVPASGLTFG
jgi:hypothetical protein